MSLNLKKGELKTSGFLEKGHLAHNFLIIYFKKNQLIIMHLRIPSIQTKERLKMARIDCDNILHTDVPVPQSPLKAHSTACFQSTDDCCVGDCQGM